MKKEYISPILLVLLQLVLALRGTYQLMFEPFQWVTLTTVTINVAIILAIYRRSAVRARKFGVYFGLLQIVVGVVFLIYGVWRFFTANLDSVIILFMGCLVTGLGYWTVSVLRMVARDFKAHAA